MFRTGLAAVLALLFLAAPTAAQDFPGSPLHLVAQSQAPAAQDGAVQASMMPPAAMEAGSDAVPPSPSAVRPVFIHPAAGILESALPAPPLMAPTRQNQALMIVGGAGLIVGAVIGGDAGTLFMVGGAVLGLYGLWDYLR